MARNISSGHAAEVYPPRPPLIIDGLMYPPGYRVGIDIAGALEPNHNGTWEGLTSDDGSLVASYYISSIFGDAGDDDWWDRHRKESDKWRLDSAASIDGNGERRLWSDPNNNEAGSGNAAFFLGYRADGIFEGIDLRTVGPAGLGWVDPSKTAYKRWRPTIEHILASARLRGPVDIPQLLDELRIAVEFGGWHARKLGSRLALTPEPLPMLRTRAAIATLIEVAGGVGLNYTLQGTTTGSRERLIAQLDEYVKLDVPIVGSQGPGRRISHNDIDWFIGPETHGFDFWSTQATGIGRTQVTNITANYLPALREPTLAALDAVIKSYQFL